MDEVAVGMKVAEFLKIFGAWGVVVLQAGALAWLAKTFLSHINDGKTKIEALQTAHASKIETLQTAHAVELKALHHECSTALQAAAIENRRSEEAKNDRLLTYSQKFAETVVDNTNALERFTSIMDRR